MDTLQNDDPEQPAPAPLRPSVGLIVMSLMNIAAGAVTASIALMGLELLWPNPIAYNLLIFLLAGLAVMVAQYLGTFRLSPMGAHLAAFTSSGCYTVTCGMLMIYGVISDLNDRDSMWFRLQDYQWVVWPTIAVITIASMWLNVRWGWKLKKRNQEIGTPPRIAISLREVFAFCFLLGLIMLPASLQAHRNQSMYRADVAAADAPFLVPSQATSINYQRDRYGLITGSYKIDEQILRDWLDMLTTQLPTDNVRTLEINAGPVSVFLPDPAQTPYMVPYSTHTVSKGLEAYWRIDQLFYTVTYDRESGTAYYTEMVVPRAE